MNRNTIFPATALLACLAIFLLATMGPAEAASAVPALADRVAALGLGMRGYVLGRPLSASQKEVAAAHPVAGAYSGTYKFRDRDLFVVVDRASDRVLAMYERREKADHDQLKAMVARLMTAFAEPTTMAHGRILYWAFTGQGPVSGEEFDLARKEKRTGRLGILATVKFNSTMEIMPAAENGSGTGKAAAQKSGTIYFIITSDPLVQAFMADREK